MTSREILTLQFGNYANYVGTHLWNIQETSFTYDENASSPSEIDHDVLYREGVDFKGHTTYTPRMLLVDLKGSLKHLPESGNLYSSGGAADATSELWDLGAVEVIEKEKIQKPQYQLDLEQAGQSNEDDDDMERDYNFKDNVQAWSEFMYARYHPRSINLVNSYEHSADEVAFDCYTNGQQLWKNEYFEDDFGDKIRQYIEECNNCQGIQTIFDCTNGFSGLTASCLEHINDDYGKSNFSVPIFTPKSLNFRQADAPMSDSIRCINIAFSFCSLIDQSDLFIPLSTMSKCWRYNTSPRKFSHINFESDNLYETSAILATYLDTITLRYRLKYSNSLLGDFCTDLNNYGKKLVSAGLSFPFPMNSDEDLIDFLDKFDGDALFTQLTPNTKIGTDRVVQSVCVRGIPKDRLKRPIETAKQQTNMAAYNCRSVSEMFQLYFQCNNYNSLSHVSAIEKPMSTKTPFAIEMFDKRVSSTGFLNEFETDVKQICTSIPVMALAQVSTDIADTLESLHREAERIKIRKIPRFKESGLEDDDYAEMLNKLLEFKDNYDDNFHL